MIVNDTKRNAILSHRDEIKQTIDGISIEQYLEQLHADFDPVYSMLMNYQCAAMEVETKFNILNNRLSIQGEHNPIESIRSRVKELDSIILKLEKNHWPITIESVEEKLPASAGSSKKPGYRIALRTFVSGCSSAYSRKNEFRLSRKYV